MYTVEVKPLTGRAFPSILTLYQHGPGQTAFTETELAEAIAPRRTAPVIICVWWLLTKCFNALLVEETSMRTPGIAALNQWAVYICKLILQDS